MKISGYPVRFWWLGVSGALMVVGSFGPWARALFVSVGGLETDRGWFTLIAGVVAAAVAFRFTRTRVRPRPWWPTAVCLVAAVVGVAVTLYFWIDLESGDSGSTSSDELFGDTDALVTVSWGLILTLVASLSLAAAAVVNFLRRGLDDTTPSLVDTTPAPSGADSTTLAETK
jgi:hypothetical protein